MLGMIMWYIEKSLPIEYEFGPYSKQNEIDF